MRPQAHDIAVPPFPPGTEWIGPEPGAVERICAARPAARPLRRRGAPVERPHAPLRGRLGGALPRSRADAWWGSTRPAFRSRPTPASSPRRWTRLEVGFPVAADSGYRIWHDYGCEGWPSLFLWGRGGALRWFHFGEGEYAATEEAIQEELRALDPDLELPEPLPCPSAQRRPGRPRRAAQRRGLPGRLGVRAVASRAKAIRRSSWTTRRAAPGRRSTGRGVLRASLDAAASWRSRSRRRAPTSWPPTSATKRTTCPSRATPGVRVYSIGFAAGVP